ncbi:uncharacterized protein LOC132721703 isoform X2 [Ruditapes philippinarum]|uniref:uncharacterized protein LOC132721703 isoform X1 n=1 Tax=Ruditapes philippinarum TaxID=129788 RepID=UPI00295BCA94|nr:uncharacterized protein LOC132721703 isoform X1 [Ruditapes philippinarum]XP_060562059.1 uncharacterized protein LOC132721703 isoform X2 [Ruditapes philippinarum]
MDERWAIRSPPPSYDETSDVEMVKDTDKRTIYVGQPQNMFYNGARFDGVSRMKIHPPPPGCEPNEYQSMLMKKDGEIWFKPAPQRQNGTSKSKNKVTPNSTVVANIDMA